MNVLYIAEKFGTTPWEITGEKLNQNARQRWYKRALAYYSEMDKKRIELMGNK
jgi:hypothetical protein